MTRGTFIVVVVLMLLSTLLAAQVVVSAHRATLAELSRPAHPCDCQECRDYHGRTK